MSLEEAIPEASIGRCNLSLLHLCGLLNFLHNLLNRGGSGSLNRLRCLGRCWLLKDLLLNLNCLGGTSLLLNRQHFRLLRGHHGVAVFLWAVGWVHRRGMVAGGGIGGGVDHRGVHDRSVVDQRSSMVDNRGMVDHRSMVDNRGVVDNRSRGIGRGNWGRGHSRGDLDNWSRGNNRGNPNHRGRSSDNGSSRNLDKRGRFVARGRLLREDCFALVGDGCVVALGSGSVGDDLDSAVGKVDAVLAASVGSVSLLRLRED